MQVSRNPAMGIFSHSHASTPTLRAASFNPHKENEAREENEEDGMDIITVNDAEMCSSGGAPDFGVHETDARPLGPRPLPGGVAGYTEAEHDSVEGRVQVGKDIQSDSSSDEHNLHTAHPHLGPILPTRTTAQPRGPTHPIGLNTLAAVAVDHSLALNKDRDPQSTFNLDPEFSQKECPTNVVMPMEGRAEVADQQTQFGTGFSADRLGTYSQTHSPPHSSTFSSLNETTSKDLDLSQHLTGVSASVAKSSANPKTVLRLSPHNTDTLPLGPGAGAPSPTSDEIKTARLSVPSSTAATNASSATILSQGPPPKAWSGIGVDESDTHAQSRAIHYWNWRKVMVESGGKGGDDPQDLEEPDEDDAEVYLLADKTMPLRRDEQGRAIVMRHERGWKTRDADVAAKSSKGKEKEIKVVFRRIGLAFVRISSTTGQYYIWDAVAWIKAVEALRSSSRTRALGSAAAWEPE